MDRGRELQAKDSIDSEVIILKQNNCSTRATFCLTMLCILFVAVVPQATAANDSPVSFVNDVVPVLTRFGCNAGSCHARAGGGQNGFELSLLGFEPQEDYDHLVREGRGRRLFPAVPEQSLLVRKATGLMPHGGGRRLASDSAASKTLIRWISEGAVWDGETAPRVTQLRVLPEADLLQSGEQRQLQVTAIYSDGSERDVTAMALFESNDSAMAEVTEFGLVTAEDIPGRVAIMVRYQGLVAVFRAAIPQGATTTDYPEERNFVDTLVFSNLKELGIPASPQVSDAVFLRRVSLDITGRLPPPDRARAFLESTDPDRRTRLIDDLLATPDYADFFAGKWSALLKNRRDDTGDLTANYAFHAWVRDSLLTNKPWDQFVRELLAATGTILSNPPVAWYKRVKEAKQQQEDVAQLFLGVRMQCAQCHHHPFERWSQDDYYGLTAFFSRVGRKPTATRGEDMIFHNRGVAESINIRSGKPVRPSALGTVLPEIAPSEDPRLKLADWMSSPDNPWFARAFVNRSWKHFFRRGLIEPEDDIRDSNPPSNPELLSTMEQEFIRSGFDIKHLIRLLTTSNAYQLSSVPLPDNIRDMQNYSRYYPRRLQAEVLLDAIDDVAGSTTSFPNLPAGTRAIALPDNSFNRNSAFLKVFGRPENESVCECERVTTSSLAQSLHLMNSGEVRSKLTVSGGTAKTLADSDLPLEQRIAQLYLAAFSREPKAQETAVAMEYLQSQTPASTEQSAPPATAWEDLLWAILNTREFMFNH